jgi:hypothetical protein
VLRTGLPVVGFLTGALAVIALFVSLNVGLTVRRFELVLATEAGTVAAVAFLITMMLRGTRSVSRLPILQTVVGAILQAVLGRHIAIGFGSGAWPGCCFIIGIGSVNRSRWPDPGFVLVQGFATCGL